MDIRIGGIVPGTRDAVAALHGRYYERHWGLSGVFEREVARELGEFLARFDPARDGAWLALHGPTVRGSIFIDGGVGDPRQPHLRAARLRWFILDDACRGQGLGRRLMGEAMGFCERVGFDVVYLWTFAGLDAARHLYDAWGFQVSESYEDAVWGARVLHQRLDTLRVTPAAPVERR